MEEDFAAKCSSELLIPAFTKGQKQLTAKKVETTGQIATVRIHIELIIGEIAPITFIKSLIDECDEDLVPAIDKLVCFSCEFINWECL